MQPGTRQGPYTVLGKLGEGGMGEVYLARDDRLGREVALKILPREFVRDPHRLALFRREALTLAALNHPQIAVIHGLEEPEPGTMFLVLERVKGESLGQRLARGPLPIAEALAVAAKVAEALEAAHERGVIHRDLKPGNIMLGPKGVVKVLDFGLARPVDPRSRAGRTAPPAEGTRGPEEAASPPSSPDAPTLAGDESASSPDAPTLAGDEPASSPDAPTLPGAPASGLEATLPGGEDASGGDAVTLPSAAEPGSAVPPSSVPSSLEELASDPLDDDQVVGTPGYMSPEQIRAEPQDERTDIFAFGCVLYECLSGERPFPGRSLGEVFTATLEKAPDYELLPPGVPPRVRDLVEHCLRKNAADRPAAIREARLVIEDVLGIRRASALRAGEVPAETPNNLPAAGSTFVGRERELEACRELLGSTRLLTLTGVPGSGKTRVALELASKLLADYPDGVWFADLGPVTEPERVVLTLALAMGLREEPGRSLVESLAEGLAGRRVLVVLDTCEHLLTASADLIARILAASPEARVIATSREVLGVAGERPFTVPTLGVPPPATAENAAAVSGFEAVRLFTERAELVRPGFALDDENARAVAEICRRLDGIPLAIELAAARVRVLAVEDIRSRLDDRFRLLTGGGRGAAARQQTLRAAIQWSYDQLAPLEQQFFRSMSAFSGGWTLEAATSVWAEDADEFEVLDLLTRLVDKSLVAVEKGPDGANRFRYLETVRQYAAEILAKTEEDGPVRSRHLDHFLELAETGEKELVGKNQKTWFARLEPEHLNFLAALAWAHGEGGEPVKALRLAGAAARFWSARGRYELGRRALADALAGDTAAEPTPERAKALVRLGGMALYRGDYEGATAPIAESLQVYRTLGDENGATRALSGLATVATYQGDYAAARGHGEEALAAYRAQGNDRGAALTLHNLGFLSLCEGDPGTAVGSYTQALGLLKKTGDLKQMALTLADLAVASVRLDQDETAATQALSSLAIVRELAAAREGAYALEGTAELAVKRGEAGRAARFLGAARRLREETGAALSPAEERQQAALLERVKDASAGADLEAAMAAGASLEFDAAMTEAAEWLEA